MNEKGIMLFFNENVYNLDLNYMFLTNVRIRSLDKICLFPKNSFARYFCLISNANLVLLIHPCVADYDPLISPGWKGHHTTPFTLKNINQ
jgi:hypothetical protein